MWKRFTVWSFLTAVAAALVAAFAPLGRVTESLGIPGGVEVTRSYGVSLFSHEGSWVLVVVAIPVLVALAGALIPARAALMTVAAIRRDPRSAPDPA